MLVILAILAAILVPALLGWIDKAREKQYVLDARSVYVATQAYIDEMYAQDPDSVNAKTGFTADEVAPIEKLADVEIGTITGITYARRIGVEGEGTTTREAEINGMTINELNGESVTATLHGPLLADMKTPDPLAGQWEVKEGC